ncbi:MAG TPA: hypothetical protein VGX71_21405 [Pseudaminobacter sp.]|nr:hypothetical protein [Pseudaminobacter sp.]
MTLTHHLDWNGHNWILVIDNGPHGRIEMTLDEFVAFAIQLKADLMIDYEEIKPLDAGDPWLTDDN